VQIIESEIALVGTIAVQADGNDAIEVEGAVRRGEAARLETQGLQHGLDSRVAEVRPRQSADVVGVEPCDLPGGIFQPQSKAGRA
jgi:hypothetical protein